MSVAFTSADGDAWLERNRDRLGQRDLVTALIASTTLRPAAALEIGCANGWRLRRLRESYACTVSGIDPSFTAVAEAHAAGLPKVHIGTAVSLPFGDEAFDTVIYGFCLYLAEPADYLRIAAEGDRVLADGGHIVIHDFFNENPFKCRYEHRAGVWSHHFNFARLWQAHPAYHVVRRHQADDECVTLLRKNAGAAFPVKP